MRLGYLIAEPGSNAQVITNPSPYYRILQVYEKDSLWPQLQSR